MQELAMVCANLDKSLCGRSASASVVLRARLLDGAGRPIRGADVAALDFSIRDIGSKDAVAVFEANSRELLLPSLAIDQAWKIDDIGYNFRHDLTAVVELLDIVAPGFDGRIEVRYVFTLVNCAREIVSFYLALT